MLFAVVVAVLHFLQGYRKVRSADSPVVIQLVFGVRPEALNAVDVVVTTGYQCLVVIDFEVLTELVQGVVADKGVGMVYRTLPGFGPDDLHQLLGRNGIPHPGIHLALALQQA